MSKNITHLHSDPYKKLGPEKLRQLHRLMVIDRLMEERMIKMSKAGDGYFWIGGPGEEAFNVPLGLLAKKGQGPAFDYFHLHYRSSGVVLGLGANPIDSLRQMRCAGTDPYSKGRNFTNHYAIREWNVVPVSPTIETQYSTCIGTAIAQKRHGGDGITIVTGGDAGTAEGDFHSCLVWANRPINPLPILICVTNNGFGISTEYKGQHGEGHIANWAKAFPDMPGKTINANDPIESYIAIEEAMAFIRKNKKPYLLEAKTSRLYGHSSSSGANRIEEPDCISIFENNLATRNLMTKDEAKKVWTDVKAEIESAYETVIKESWPEPETIWDHFYYGEEVDDSFPKKGGS